MLSEVVMPAAPFRLQNTLSRKIEDRKSVV